MPKLVGQAIYLELVPDKDNLTEDELRRATGWKGADAVKQVVIYPARLDDTGRKQSTILMSRVVSENAPRSQWDWSRVNSHRKLKEIIPPEDSSSYSNTVYYDNSEWELLPEVTRMESDKMVLSLLLKREMYSTSYEFDESGERVFNTIQGWVIRGGKPIAVEVTDEDYSDLHDKSKTPQAVIRRINKVRDSLAEYPAKLV